jgi:glucose-1-phosphate thymidylyltransferase
LVDLDGDRVVDFQEKPDDPKSTLVSIACYAFPADDLPLFEEYLDAGENPDEPGWFIQWMQARQAVHAFTFDGAWFDIGTPESYLDAVAWHLDGDDRVHPTASVEDSRLRGDVHVMAGAEVVDSTLERTVVFPDATIRNADVRGSIIDEETRVENLDLADALIGAHSTMTNGADGD